MFLSIIIPVFNRQEVVCRSIASAIDCFKGASRSFEVIVVDDGSRDQSLKVIRHHFAEELDSGLVRLFATPQNRGVSKARNHGAAQAEGRWLMFLDSDDHLLDSARDGIIKALEDDAASPVVFFRCVDEKGHFIGVHFDNKVILDMAGYARNATFGEAMAVVRRDAVLDQAVFDESLVGYEGLSLLRLIARHGPAVLSPVVARVYDRSGQDRLSTFTGMMKRADTLARGHRLLVREFGGTMSQTQAIKFQVKALVYMVLGTCYRILQRGRTATS